MGPLAIGLYMAAAVFWAVGLFHSLIWARRPGASVHLLFALTAFFSGFGAIAEVTFYNAPSVSTFNEAFRWSNNLSVLCLVAVVWFIVGYAKVWPTRKWLPLSLSLIFVGSAIVNTFQPFGFLYREISGLRHVVLPWGESIALAEGTSSPWRILTDLAFVGLIVLVVASMRRIRGQKGALQIGGSLLLFMALLLGSGIVADLNLLPIPYLFTWGYLPVALAMSHELAGEVVRASALSEEVRANERRFRSLLENVQLLVIGVDGDGKVDYINPSFTRVTGYTPEETLGEPWPENDVLKTKSGEERKIVWSRVLLRDASDAVTGSLSIGADVTEQRRAERAREEALREIETLKRRLEEEVIYLRGEITTIGRFGDIVGKSDALRYVLQKVEEVAPLNTTVLIEGETGVGKELFARAIHDNSPRRNRPLVKVNCSALPANLIEAELFGHERGAFTGASKLRKGRFELADGGTLLLDEVGELPLELQGKLLRVLQEGELERLGGEATIRVDVRILAATNRDLKAEVDRGRFREDLFYRLHVYPITVPTLRQRKEDIPVMVDAFVERFSRSQGKRIEQLPQPVLDALVAYDWPGNVRELENVIERAVVTSRGKKLQLAAPLRTGSAPSASDGYRGTLAEVEKEYIIRVLDLSEWRIEGKEGAADLLGLHPNTLRFRMRKLGIERPQLQKR